MNGVMTASVLVSVLKVVVVAWHWCSRCNEGLAIYKVSEMVDEAKGRDEGRGTKDDSGDDDVD